MTKLKTALFSDRILFFLFSLSLSPFLLSRLDYSTDKINIIYIVLITIPLIYFLGFIFYSDNVMYNIQKLFLPNLRFLRLFLIFTLCAFITEIFNAHKIKDIIAFLQLIYVFCSFFIILIILNATNKSEMVYYKLINYLVFLGVCFTLFSIVNEVFPHQIVEHGDKYYMQTNFFLGFSLRQEVMGVGLSRRYSSIFSNPNNFAFFLFLTIVLSTINFTNGKLTNRKKIATLILFIGLLRSGSRNSLISLIVYIIIYFISKIKSSYDIKKFIRYNYQIVVSGLVLIAIIVVLLYRLRGFSSSNGRMLLWKEAMEVFTHHIFTGIGTYKTRELSRSYGVSHFHNSYIQLLVSGGLLFLSSYILLHFYIIKAIFLNRSSVKFNYLISFELSLLFYQFFESTVLIIHPYLALIVFFLVYSMNIYKEEMLIS